MENSWNAANQLRNQFYFDLVCKFCYSFFCCHKSRCSICVTETKIYVPKKALLTQDNVKLLDQLKPGFKKTVKQV